MKQKPSCFPRIGNVASPFFQPLEIAVFSAAIFFGAVCAFADGAKQHPAIPKTSEFGVNIHFTKQTPGELAMIRAAGFKWVRMDLNWGGIEREKGNYDFSEYDGLVADLTKNGLKGYFILDYANDRYDGGLSPHTDEGRAAFAKWARG